MLRTFLSRELGEGQVDWAQWMLRTLMLVKRVLPECLESKRGGNPEQLLLKDQAARDFVAFVKEESGLDLQSIPGTELQVDWGLPWFF